VIYKSRLSLKALRRERVGKRTNKEQARKAVATLRERDMSGRGRSSSPSGRRGRSNSPENVVPVPSASVGAQNLAEIDQIIANDYADPDENDSTYSGSGKHLELLPADYNLHKKNAQGITTRAVWLDWEGHRDKYIVKGTVPQRLSDEMVGVLWKRKQGGNAFASAWVQREFKAEMIPGIISYKTTSRTSGAAGDTRTMWLTPGCIVHRIDGYCFGRACCIRVIWPSGFDLILSTLTPLDCANWYEYLCLMMIPPREVLRERERLIANKPELRALQMATIRSQKYKELRPFYVENKLYLRISHSVSDKFVSLTDEALFDARDALDPIGESRKWALGYPQRRYTELPEIHYASLPSISPYCEAWDLMVSTFPNRHQEEVRRFLVGAKFDVNRASLALRKHIDWRAATIPIRPEGIIKDLKKGKCFVHGLDHYGHPVIYYFTHRQDPRTRSIDEAIRAILYRLEQAIARLPSRDGKVSLVVVREGASAANRDIDLVLPLSKLLEENYPERLHQCLVYPARTIFRTYIAVAGGTALSSDTISRIVPVSEKSDLAMYIPVTNLLEGLGGTDKYNFAADCARVGSAILTPPLWTLPEAGDYYPPIAGEDEYLGDGGMAGAAASAGAGAGAGKGFQGGEESKAELEYVCHHCVLSQCKLCRVAGKADPYYGGWRPMDLSAFPDPVV